ncbi:hypothetical protein [Parafrankia sp. EUN1f]|uniref:hypothetical protein n=1 Tax=Parafrankia sp. EUN1f TaxID=102897 RepID=UPI0001C43D80|nr:hypothetical protein [Parafrankia sp. EUN1f]EFC86140.1 hypothetical protein FrEUN1fDRAFT_0751 [Parafrankia sp. EUN1f]
MLLERTSARPVGSMPAGGGAPNAAPIFDEDLHGPTCGYLAARVPLTYALMVAALVDGETLTREDLRTPAEVRHEVEFHIAFRGMASVFETADRLSWERVGTDEWVVFCRQAVMEMLAAEGVISGVDQLTADELAAGLMHLSDRDAEDLTNPIDVRYELTRIAYTRGVDAFRQAAAEPFEVDAPAFDTEAHAWPGFCRQAVAGMLASDAAAVAA